jgi:hypothetical protein
MVIDLSEEHELCFYRDGDQIIIRGRDAGKCYELNVSFRLSAMDIVKSIQKINHDNETGGVATGIASLKCPCPSRRYGMLPSSPAD